MVYLPTLCQFVCMLKCRVQYAVRPMDPIGICLFVEFPWDVPRIHTMSSDLITLTNSPFKLGALPRTGPRGVNNEGRPIHSILAQLMGWPFIFAHLDAV